MHLKTTIRSVSSLRVSASPWQMIAAPVDRLPSPRMIVLEASPMSYVSQGNLLFPICFSSQGDNQKALWPFSDIPCLFKKKETKTFVSKTKTKSNQNKNAVTQILQGTNPGDT